MLRTYTFWLGLLLGLVFATRVIYFFTVTYPEVGLEIRKPDGYWEIAENLLTGRGYVYDAYTAEVGQETARRGPLPSLIYLVFFWVVGVSAWPILMLNWLLCVGIGWLIYKIARLLFPTQLNLSLLAVALYVVFWPEFKATAEARSEILFTFFLTAFIFTLLKAFQTNQLRWYVWAGLLLGLAQHTKPVVSPFPIVVLAFILWFNRAQVRHGLVRFAVFATVFGLVLAPWVVRNYLLFNKVIPGSTLLGLVIYHDFRDHLYQRGLLQDAAGNWTVPAEWIVETTSNTDYRLGKSEIELDALWLQTGLKFIQKYPGEFVLWSINNTSRFWVNMGRSKWDHPNSTGVTVAGVVNGLALVLAGLAVVVAKPLRRAPALLLPVLVVYYTAVHTLTSGELRYSLPMGPFLLVLSAVAIGEAWAWVKGEQFSFALSGLSKPISDTKLK